MLKSLKNYKKFLSYCDATKDEGQYNKFHLCGKETSHTDEHQCLQCDIKWNN